MLVAKKVVGLDKFITDFEPSMGGEDFSFFLEKIVGAYVYLGTYN